MTTEKNGDIRIDNLKFSFLDEMRKVETLIITIILPFKMLLPIPTISTTPRLVSMHGGRPGWRL
jgi:hypothetical protein